MYRSVRRVLSQTALSTTAIGVLLLALVAADGRFREQFALHFSSRPTEAVTIAGRQVQDLTVVFWQAARYQSIAHAPLVIFVVAAIALVVFMLRT